MYVIWNSSPIVSIKVLNMVSKTTVIQAVTWPTNKAGHFLWRVVEHPIIGTWINTSKEDIAMTIIKGVD
jgi:hypothetical protein